MPWMSYEEFLPNLKNDRKLKAEKQDTKRSERLMDLTMRNVGFTKLTAYM